MPLDTPIIQPPFKCIFCDAAGPFCSEEHVVPHSLGNDLVVLAPGWVCDTCNSIFGAFESRVLHSSILGVERCRLGVVTKKLKPARSVVGGVTWFAEPALGPNVLSAEAKWHEIPTHWSNSSSTGKIVLPVHDESNSDIARLLLKIAVELIAVVRKSSGAPLRLASARAYVLDRERGSWPYFLLRSRRFREHITSVFQSIPDAHDYVRACGFDLYLHQVDDQDVLFFEYGNFFAAIGVSSSTPEWSDVLRTWRVPFVGCPVEFADVYG